MFVKRCTNCLLVLTLIYLQDTGADNDMTAFRGDPSVSLPCHKLSNDTEGASVKWTKNKEVTCTYQIIKQNKSFTTNCKPRFNLSKESLALTIEEIQLSDSGQYSCEITRLIPPPSYTHTSNLTLHVEVRPDLSLQILNRTGICVDLLCALEGLKLDQVNFTWSREGHNLSQPSTSFDMSSELRLCKPEWSEGDTITCNASYSRNQTVYSKRTQLSNPDTYKEHKSVSMTALITIISIAAALIILCIIFTALLCKGRRRDDNGSVVFTNKVYENFSFAMSRQMESSNAKPQREECIYEN